MKKTLLLLLVGILASSFKPVENRTLLIAAAADLRFAMDSLITVFQNANPSITIKVSYGSSGNFFEQISNGAPYDIFFSADMDYPQKLKDKGLVASDITQYGVGQIVLWSKVVDPNKNKMNTLLSPAINKIAIANPEHAPYGKKAQESLIYYNLYDQVKSKLVLGENISQTAQFVSSGSADVGIIALSLAKSPAMQKEGGKYWLIPEKSHQPLQQAFITLQHAKNNMDAVQFSAFISSSTAKTLLKYFGFSNK